MKTDQPTQILLLGGGDSEDMRTGIQELARRLPSATASKLLFLPQAAEPSQFEEYAEWMKVCFQVHQVPIGSFVYWENLAGKTYSKDLREFDAMWIGGGNTFLLLDQIRKSGFEEPLREFLAAGKLVAGNSAGAIILGSDIRYAHDPNEVGMTNFAGFSCFADYTVWCHDTKQRYRDEILQYVKKSRRPAMAIPDKSSVRALGNEIQNLGDESMTLYAKDGSVVQLSKGQSIHL